MLQVRQAILGLGRVLPLHLPVVCPGVPGRPTAQPGRHPQKPTKGEKILPYILRRRRGLQPQNAGELNYALSQQISSFLDYQEAINGGESYQAYNDVLGALEGIKLEFYRRRVVPYEDAKRLQNGDIPLFIRTRERDGSPVIESGR